MQNGADTFKLWNLLANHAPVLDLYGNGNAVWHQGGLKVDRAGVVIDVGGACMCPPCVSACRDVRWRGGAGETIDTGGMSSGTSVPHGAGLIIDVAVPTGYTGKGGVTADALDRGHWPLPHPHTGNGLSIVSPLAPDTSFNILSMTAGGQPSALWRGDGGFEVLAGGLDVRSGACVCPPLPHGGTRRRDPLPAVCVLRQAVHT